MAHLLGPGCPRRAGNVEGKTCSTPGHDDAVLDHVSIQVADHQRSAAFYDAVLAPLGGGRMLDLGEVIGYGVARPTFWIGPVTTAGEPREVHIAFHAEDRAAVTAFHDAAVAFGAEVLHEPRAWPEYHPDYFGAFVRDPEGNNVEAVCHAPA
jgi:catechol 2,3-dioxygenase-like lactoylglutathione lyase family enzyme